MRASVKTMTLRNDFHGTEVRLRPRPGGTISAATHRRARRALCPHEGCRCFSSSASGEGVLPLLHAQPIYDGQSSRVVAYWLPEEV